MKSYFYSALVFAVHSNAGFSQPYSSSSGIVTSDDAAGAYRKAEEQAKKAVPSGVPCNVHFTAFNEV